MLLRHHTVNIHEARGLIKAVPKLNLTKMIFSPLARLSLPLEERFSLSKKLPRSWKSIASCVLWWFSLSCIWAFPHEKSEKKGQRQKVNFSLKTWVIIAPLVLLTTFFNQFVVLGSFFNYFNLGLEGKIAKNGCWWLIF